jgi:hypothetical protein
MLLALAVALLLYTLGERYLKLDAAPGHLHLADRSPLAYETGERVGNDTA